MQQYNLTNRQARRFILLKQGLIGGHKFAGKEGIKQFINQAGCVQYDPIDICGKNAELVLQARIKGFRKQMLYDLLYKDRALLDYYDKNLAIIRTGDWKYFKRIRDYFKIHSLNLQQVEAVSEQIKELIREKGSVCSKDIDFGQKLNWYWGNDTSLSRVALETMYFMGELIIHHKKGTIKYYCLSEDFIPEEDLQAEDPNPKDEDYLEWNILRRISAAGLLWNKPSDAWLFIRNMKAQDRNKIFLKLLKENKIIEVSVENMKEKLYCLEADRDLIEEILKEPVLKPRTEFLAPLDNMIWDRKLIKALFNFDYKWEIYTPESERRFGYYVLPILSGDRFIGRIEIINNRKIRCLQIKNIWLEPDMKQTKKLSDSLRKTINRFAKFNDCEQIEYSSSLFFWNET
ncbi:crosslink repair DNA glycosylase YcaQ family protein [Anaerocolumna sp. AGMB13025]|uniref:winged helix-turn-helix domain-containing protein n=1 Tax=Anaerocolumna sp. AGMB13025 TaxID=3039116 RepID=UPI00241D011C|nr:crosslink repair DNA glycosylase YcaQ family protein [Anaerocolumna sp. AGMB13025]WFR54881.1 crosslink repair DNA glycosylase YcaQ family protein [Anaerocolumna sp. AGMB13025]